MQSFGDIPLQNRLKRWSKYIIGTVILAAIVVLIGWQFDIHYFKSPLHGSKEMNPAAAVAFILSGCSFLLLTSTSISQRRIGKMLALLVLMIGSAKLFFYITGINLFIDELLFPGKIGPDRIVAIASVCFILTGVSLLLVHAKGKSNERISDAILLLLIGFSVFSILGYFFQVNLFYGLLTYVPMAIHAAICLLLISLGIFFYKSDTGLMQSLTTTLAGSIVARRLIPAAILVPVLLGILRTVAHEESIFTIEFGITILVFTIIGVLLTIIWHNTVLLNKRDLEGQKAEKAQRQSEEQIQTIFRSAPDAVIVINEEGTIIKWNPKAEDIFGWESKEVIGKPLHETIIPQRYREAHKIGLRHFLKSGESPVLGKAFEIQAINKNNIELDVSLSISPTVVDGKYLSIGFVRDITEQKKAGEQLKESEEKFKKVFQASSAGISITRLSDASFLDVNDAFTKLSGFSREELIGHTSAQLGMIVDIDKRERVLHQLRELGSSKNFEISIRDKSGKILNVLASTETIFLQGEKYALNIIYDITEQKKAEQKFRGLLESAPDAMIIVNENGAIVLANHQTEILFGYQKQELISQQVEMLLPGDLQRKHETHRSNYFKHRRVRSMGAGIELFGVRKDGSRFPVEISLSPLETSEETLVSAAIRDITDRKHAETIIQKQKQDIQDFIDSMSTMCAKVATDGRLLLVNKIAIRASGLSIKELMNTNFLEGQWWTYNPDVIARVCKAFKKACSGIAINYDENIFVFGQILPINFSLMPILGLDGNVDYIVAEARDIASIKVTEAALQKRTGELEQANRELEAFSYSVSHDLRAPLRIIDGYTEIMINDYGGKLDEEGNRMFGILRENTAKMGQLIDDLLNLSRLGRKELIIQAVNMKQIVESVVADQGNTKNKQLKIEIGELCEAEGDSNLLRQVWINLVSNAIKYSKGKEKPAIRINSNATAQEIIYSIKDNGAGFNMKYADKLFGVFQRLHKMTEYEGTGVGLALVHRIVTRHGGRVWAEAEVNKGATFYFSLPVQEAEQTTNLIKQYQTI